MAESKAPHYVAHWRTSTGWPNFLVFTNREDAAAFLERKRAGGAYECDIEEYHPRPESAS